jgi:hypothetical protein
MHRNPCLDVFSAPYLQRLINTTHEIDERHVTTMRRIRMNGKDLGWIEASEPPALRLASLAQDIRLGYGAACHERGREAAESNGAEERI